MKKDEEIRPISAMERLMYLLDVAAEHGQTALPILLLVMGIGLVNILPPQVTRSYYSSTTERQQLAMRHGVTLLDEVVYIVSNQKCSDCTKLAGQLQEANIPFELIDHETSPMGDELYKRAIKVWGDKTLPQVIIGLDTVEPHMDAIRQVLGLSAVEVGESAPAEAAPAEEPAQEPAAG